MLEQRTIEIFRASLACAAGLCINGCATDDPEVGDDSLVERSMVSGGLKEYMSEARAAKGRMFLAENGTKPGVVSRPSGLQYVILEEGDGERARLEDTVITHYSVRSVDGRMLDNSEDYGEPQEFKVKKVIAGWREALREMKVGSTWRLYVPPQLAYGETGMANIPGGETLIYELQLLGVKKPEIKPVDTPAVADTPVVQDDPSSVSPTPDLEVSGLELPEPGTETRRGDLSFDNLDLLD